MKMLCEWFQFDKLYFELLTEHILVVVHIHMQAGRQGYMYCRPMKEPHTTTFVIYKCGIVDMAVMPGANGHSGLRM
jgi:hypothetical protein